MEYQLIIDLSLSFYERSRIMTFLRIAAPLEYGSCVYGGKSSDSQLWGLHSCLLRLPELLHRVMAPIPHPKSFEYHTTMNRWSNISGPLKNRLHPEMAHFSRLQTSFFFAAAGSGWISGPKESAMLTVKAIGPPDSPTTSNREKGAREEIFSKKSFDGNFQRQKLIAHFWYGRNILAYTEVINELYLSVLVIFDQKIN